MVVDDDDVHAARATEHDGLPIAGAAVAGHHQGTALVEELRDITRRQAVARRAMRHPRDHLRPESAQHGGENRRGGHAVHVVVSEHADAFACGHRRHQPVECAIQIRYPVRRAQISQPR